MILKRCAVILTDAPFLFLYGFDINSKKQNKTVFNSKNRNDTYLL